MPPITGDERFYNALQQFDWYYMEDKYEYHYAKKFIRPEDKVLEVGCGKGAFARILDTKKYIGLDFSSKARELAEDYGIVIMNETIENYSRDYPNNFDVVVSFQTLEHVSNPKSFIEAKIRVLKQGGIMIIAVPSEDSFLKYTTNSLLNMPPHHVTRWSDETLKYIALKYNLELIVLHHEKLQPYHKIWFFATVFNCILKNNKLIDISFKNKLVNKVSSLLGRILANGLKNEMLPNGHTVVVVYRKR